MKRSFLSAVLAVTVSMVGCAGSLNTFPVNGRETALAKMRGEWSGEYSSPSTGRTGSIRFALDLAHSSGEGEVMMNVPGEATPRTLHIASIKVEGNELHGKLKHYVDPACNCQVETEFVGVVVGENVDGTFSMKPVGKSITFGGTWHAERMSM